jgi:hypothetical protein
MAFWRERLLEIGGFDPIYRAAGDDVDACWKLLDRGYEIRYHPSAVVWHRRRGSIWAFWRQQVGYGRAEALVERKHPDRFNDLGQAIWRGVVYGPTSILPGQARLYSGQFGEAPFQRLYGKPDFFDPLPVLVLIVALIPLALLSPYLLLPPAAVLAALLAVYLRRGVRVARRSRLHPAWRSGALIGLLHFVPPIARAWGRLRTRNLPAPTGSGSFWPLRRAGRGLLLTEGVDDVGREAFLEGLRSRLHAAGLRPAPSSEWDEEDVRCDSLLFWRMRMISYERWGVFYLRLDRRLRSARFVLPVLGVAFLGLWSLAAAVGATVGLLTLSLAEGWIFGWRVRRVLTTISSEDSHVAG